MRGLREIEKLKITSRFLASIFKLSEPVSSSIKWVQLEHLPCGTVVEKGVEDVQCSQCQAYGKHSVNVSSSYLPKVTGIPCFLGNRIIKISTSTETEEKRNFLESEPFPPNR